jgi:carbohydrate kinase (thermoresistant glucokinase family)
MTSPGSLVRAIVVFGVSGSGKSTFAKALAERLTYDFCDADDLHSAANIEKMRAGQPLTDEDRGPWLEAVGQRMRDTIAKGQGIVVACSALKRSYRDLLREYEPSAFLIFLDGTHELIKSRVLARHGGFMPSSLLSSQFAILEPMERDEAGIRIDVSDEISVTVQIALKALSTIAISESES